MSYLQNEGQSFSNVIQQNKLEVLQKNEPEMEDLKFISIAKSIRNKIVFVKVLQDAVLLLLPQPFIKRI